MRPEDLSHGARIVSRRSGFSFATQKSGLYESFPLENKDLPMIEQKKTSELVETSLICLLSAGVAIGAFLVMWLIAVLTGVA